VPDGETAAAESAPGARKVTGLPVAGFGLVEDEKDDWVLVRVRAHGEVVATHFMVLVD
jgi:hypothetical protein